MTTQFLHFIALQKRYSAHTVKAYKEDITQFENFLLSYADSKSLDYTSVTRNDIRSWLMHLKESQYEPKSIHRKLASLRSFFKFLHKNGFIAKKPTNNIVGPKIKKRLPVFVKESEMNSDLLNSDLNGEHEYVFLRNVLIMELLYGTGMRLSELVGLKENDINFNDQTLTVLGKGNKQRRIPLHKDLVELMHLYNICKNKTFKEVQIDTSFLLTNKGKKIYPVFVQRIVKMQLSKSTTEKKSPHVLRHTFATHLLNKGADLNAIKELLGHSSLAATQVYTHNSIEQLKLVFNQAHPKA